MGFIRRVHSTTCCAHLVLIHLKALHGTQLSKSRLSVQTWELDAMDVKMLSLN